MADIDLLEAKKERRALFEKLRLRASWLSFDEKKETEDRIRTTFSTIHSYLAHITSKSVDELKKRHLQHGMVAIMGLAEEAASKVDGLKAILHPNKKLKSVKEYPEFKELETFYKQNVQAKIARLIEEDREPLYEPSGKRKKADHLIRELETLNKDEEYELMFIKKEDGTRFFSSELIEHLKLVTDFDLAIMDFIQDKPLQMVRVIQDEEAWTVAKEIYDYANSSIETFLKAYKSHLDDSISPLLYRALIALIAAKNPQNLLKSHRKKTCLGYFKDFHYYLKETINHQAFLTLAEDAYHQKIREVMKALSGWFFLHPMTHPKAVETLKGLINKGQLSPIKRHSIWQWFLESYEHLAHAFSKHPSGPILKLIDQYERGEFDHGFSSIAQGNYPSRVFEFDLDGKKVGVLHLPSPTIQKEASHAQLIHEFEALLALHADKKFLIFNLQDKQVASRARAAILEKAFESHPNLHVVSLPKDTPFYNQEHEYSDLNEAHLFMKALHDQLHGAPITGFSFPKSVNKGALLKFSEKLIPWIHEQFFAQNKILTRKNRQDFIELFYGFIVFKLIELEKPDFLSMTCKDALDIGALGTLQLYAFSKIFTNQMVWDPNERDRILELALVPAFINRSRLLLLNRFNRMYSMLTVLDGAININEKSLKALFLLYPHLKIRSVDWVEEAA